jgi:uncharacterized protein (TIGR03437 family)
MVGRIASRFPAVKLFRDLPHCLRKRPTAGHKFRLKEALVSMELDQSNRYAEAFPVGGVDRKKSPIKRLPLLAATALLLTLGAGHGFAQCPGTVTTKTAAVRVQGVVEALGTVTISCTITPATSVLSVIAITLGSSSGNVVAVAGSTTFGGWTSICSPATADLKNTFPCPSLSSTLPPVTAPNVSVSGSSIAFNFTPSAGTQTFTIQGIRINAANSGQSGGGTVAATVAMGGGLSGVNDVLLGFFTSVIDPSTGFANSPLPLRIASCNPPIPIPPGTPSFLGANPDPSATASNSLKVSLVEGSIGSFVSALFSDNGSIGTQGVRFRIQLTGIPSGIVVYAPEFVSATAAPTTGSVVSGGAATAITLVTGATLDGSGGVPLPGAFPNRFDLIAASAGTVTLVYEVVSSASLTGLETVNLFVALAGTVPTGLGTISGSVSLAPVGPSTANPSLPQFIGPAGTTLAALVESCSGTLPALPSSPSILLSASKASFITPFGTNPTPQTLDVLIAAPSPLSWSASISSISGGSWLSLSPTSGTGNVTVTLTAKSVGLPLGSYSAVVLFSAPGTTNGSITLPVTLDVAAVLLSATPSALNFSSIAGTSPASQQLTIATNAGTLAWRASATTTSGGNWLSVTPTSGATPATATISVNSQALTAGTYQGLVTISADGAANGAQVVGVTLTLGAPPPSISPNGILQGASFSRDGVVSSGSAVSIFGLNLATATATATSLPLQTVMGGAQVLVNNIPAPLYYVSSVQINFQMPVVTGSSAQVVVVTNQIRSLAATVAIAPAAPGLYTVNSAGFGQGIVANEDSSLNSAQNPARIGSVIAIFGTGFGATDPPLVPGQAPGNTLSVTLTKPVVFIGGVAAEVQFSGLVPGTAGAYQVNARIPTGLPAGPAVSVFVSIGGANSNTVTVALQ